MTDPQSLGYYYLASPYSHKLREIRISRVKQTMQAQAWMKRNGLITYSPIVHWHFVAEVYELPTDAKSWTLENDVMISRSDGVLVLMLENWKSSVGVTHEIDYAQAIGKSTQYVQPLDTGNYVLSRKC